MRSILAPWKYVFTILLLLSDVGGGRLEHGQEEWCLRGESGLVFLGVGCFTGKVDGVRIKRN
jgi:hypothetical protein